jgi:N-acetylglucosamine-6-sulfatase
LCCSLEASGTACPKKLETGQDREEEGASMKRKMSRSTFLFGVGGAAALASLRLQGSEAAQTGRRNVLWVIDDDHPQYMMDSMPVTRHKIRDLGTNFISGSTDIPLCGPARVSLLTGLSVTTHECDTNGTWPKFEGSSRGLGERTVARHLKDAGYTTGHFGKYINAHWKSRSVPPYWDRWCETLGDGSDTVGDATTPNRANVDGVITDLLPGILSVWSAERCADFVRARANSPWFAQYCPTIPHFPYTPSTSSKHLYDGAKRRAPSINEADMSDKPKWMRDLPRIKAQAEFEGKKEELADLDRYGLRPILAALEATSQLANTVIFFTSDNGYLHGEHHLRAKDKPYWECSEVPFFVKGPGVKSGVTRTALVNHTDLMPTTCAIAGIRSSSLDVDGRSMLTNFGRRTFSGWRKRMLVSGSNDVGPEMNPGGSNDPSGRWWLLREGRTAFILRENGTKELYRMKWDPYQERSKARAAKRTLIERLTDTVKAMRAAGGQTRRQLEEAP